MRRFPRRVPACLVKNHYISLTLPSGAGCLTFPTTYHPFPRRPGSRHGGGEVLESGYGIKAGDFVFGLGGWETHSTIPVEFAPRSPTTIPSPCTITSTSSVRWA